MPPIVSYAIKQLEELRKLRGSRVRDISIATAVEATANQAASTQRKLGELIEIWERQVPAAIANRSTLIGIRAGVLNITIDSSSAAFELDRLLRSGLINALRSEYRGTLTRVKWKIAAETDETNSRNAGAKGDRTSNVRPRGAPKRSAAARSNKK
jgi:hypothetical protein